MEMFWSVLFVCVFIVHPRTQAAETSTNPTEPTKLTTTTTTSVTDDRPLNTQPYASSERGNDVFTISSHSDKKTPLYPPQTYNLDNIVTSGPIILVDKKSLFIPNFKYNGDHKNVHFWVGNGSAPSSNGILVPNEKGSHENLHSYQGQNLNITLPSGITTDNIEYFGIWSIDEDISLGHVPIKGIENVPQVSNRKNTVASDSSKNITSMRLPKCCPLNSVLTVNGCERREILPSFQPPFNIYKHNATHFNNVSLNVDFIEFLPYTSAPKCDNGKYPLDEQNEEFALLQNNSLLVKGSVASGILLADEFCLEQIEEDNNTYQMKILVCVPEHKIEKAMFVTYVALTIISTFCLAITFVLYFFWLKVEDVHRRCFTAYAFTMTMTFLSLTIVQTTNVDNGGCEVLGFLFQIFMIASFTLLGILCFDIFIIIKFLNAKKYLRLRKQWYLIVAVGVPLLFLIISLARNLTPDVPNSFFKPQYLSNTCIFEAEDQRTIIFYVPICLSMLVSIIFLAWSRFVIVQNDRDSKYDEFWAVEGTLYKFMWRKHFIIILTSIMWSIETMIRMKLANANMLIAIDVVEASQGILVLLLFVVNKRTRADIVDRIKEQRQKRRRRRKNCSAEDGYMMASSFLKD